MENEKIIGISVVLFIYVFFSWALGRFINKHKKKEATEFQNLLSGAWIIAAVVAFFTIYSYIG